MIRLQVASVRLCTRDQLCRRRGDRSGVGGRRTCILIEVQSLCDVASKLSSSPWTVKAGWMPTVRLHQRRTSQRPSLALQLPSGRYYSQAGLDTPSAGSWERSPGAVSDGSSGPAAPLLLPVSWRTRPALEGKPSSEKDPSEFVAFSCSLSASDPSRSSTTLVTALAVRGQGCPRRGASDGVLSGAGSHRAVTLCEHNCRRSASGCRLHR